MRVRAGGMHSLHGVPPVAQAFSVSKFVRTHRRGHGSGGREGSRPAGTSGQTKSLTVRAKTQETRHGQDSLTAVRSFVFNFLVSFVSAQRTPHSPCRHVASHLWAHPTTSRQLTASSIIVYGQRHVALEDNAPHGFREGVRSGMAGHHKHDVVNPSPTR